MSWLQLGALGAVAGRELSWVLPNVSRQVERWQGLAARIPDAEIRADATSTLVEERFNTEGAALFATLPRRRNDGLLRLLANFQIMVDYLDTVSERPCADMVANGSQLHRALAEALDPGGPISDYYRYHPWQDDGGYLRTIVEACREECERLPSFDDVRPYVLPEAMRLEVCAINHQLDPAARDADLEAWVQREFPNVVGFHTFEISAAATSSLTVHALLALAAEAACSPHELDATRAAYFPWVSLMSTMLDSYADLVEDLRTGSHSYIDHYGGFDEAIERIQEIVSGSLHLASRLPRGRRHALIVTGMLAMYLTEKSTQCPSMRTTSRRIMEAGGSLPWLIRPILQIWRHHQIAAA